MSARLLVKQFIFERRIRAGRLTIRVTGYNMSQDSGINIDLYWADR